VPHFLYTGLSGNGHQDFPTPITATDIDCVLTTIPIRVYQGSGTSLFKVFHAGWFGLYFANSGFAIDSEVGWWSYVEFNRADYLIPGQLVSATYDGICWSFTAGVVASLSTSY